MTPEIAAVLAITLLAVVLFITEKMRVDVVALVVLVALALTGLVTPAEALSGFSNPAVVTVWAVLILSAGLYRTGVASLIGEHLITLAKDSEPRLVLIIMLTVGVLSGFMNNIGVIAMMLPVVIDAARRKKIPPSRLLLPLAFSAHLGGMTTLIGTPPNILISEALFGAGLQPFSMFDYTPTGLAALIAGILFLVIFSGRLLPSRDISKEIVGPDISEMDTLYGMQESMFTVKLPTGSPLSGKTLGQSRLGSLAGVNVLAVMREDHTHIAPDVMFGLQSNDCLLVSGSAKRFAKFIGKRQLVVVDEQLPIETLTSKHIHLAEVKLSPQSDLWGKTIGEIELRLRYRMNVLAIWRDGLPHYTNMQTMPLSYGDSLLVQGSESAIESLQENANFQVSSPNQAQVHPLHERLLSIFVPPESELVGKTLAEGHLGDAYGLQILGIERGVTVNLMPSPDERLESEDTLIVEGQPEDLELLRGLQTLDLNPCDTLQLEQLESQGAGLAEVILSPRSSQSGNTLREMNFREKYGLSVIAIWREGRSYRANLRDIALKIGDLLLVFGHAERLKILNKDREFLVLSQQAAEEPRKNKALLAVIIMVAVLLPVILGWIPIPISAVMGATLMVLVGCLTIDEAYHSIEWKAIFLIAGMLPLGIALETTGAANLLAEGMLGLIGAYGSTVVMAGLFLLAAIASQVMPNPAVAVLLAPIALSTAMSLDVSPYPFMMIVAIAASAAFLSPVGHPANVLIMGPGGYRFSDFTRIGVPLVLIVLVVSLIVVPLVWPF